MIILLKRQRLKQELQLKAMYVEKLEEVDRMKSRFFANISHEFRTPLTLIQGPIKQILTDEFKGNLKEQCRMILRNSQRLLHLINQLLDLSKLESGNFSLKVRRLDAVALLKRIVMSFSSLSESKQISLNFVPEQNTINAYIDCDVVEKIVSNLLSNAFKFTPKGGGIKEWVLSHMLMFPQR